MKTIIIDVVEYNLTPKIAFCEGDWVVSPNGVYWHIDAIQDGMYQVSSDSGKCAEWPLDTNIYHRFNIQDAKDGDVLVFKNNIGGIIICKSPTDYDTRSYCRLVSNSFVGKEEGGWDSTLLHPATKEQRDTLFKAMADAGYTFDFDKKELNKIENKSTAWSEEDETMITDLSVIVHTYFSEISGIPFKYDLSEDKIRTWLKSLKDRVLPQPKQEWSEEDEKVIHCLEYTVKHFYEDEDTIKWCCDWLKSLKPQNKWKPSDEQMKVLKELVEDNNQRYFYTLLKSLYEQLKILKGE